MTINITLANAVEWALAYEGPLFHALLCDPPYHLTSITDRFGKAGSAPAQHGTDGAFARASRGFMNATWDGGDVAFRPETWAAFGRVLHPGAFGMAFASTRGWHRMACAIEDAGFIIHPVIMAWAFGSGFPKATRPDIQIAEDAFWIWLETIPGYYDHHLALKRKVKETATAAKAKRADKELAKAAKVAEAVFKLRDRILKLESGIYIDAGSRKHAPKFAAADFGYREKDNGFNSRDHDTYEVLIPVLEEAARWLGHRYGLQALKPALEPVIVFQKPYQGRPIDCITRTGAGAINIDGGRIATDEDEPNIRDNASIGGQARGIWGSSGVGRGPSLQQGRWPSNLILSHHPECNGHCVELCPVRRLGEQSGDLAPTGSAPRNRIAPKFSNVFTHSDMPSGTMGGYDDSGTAARYFYNADWMLERLEDSDPLIYQAKASTAEREAGLEDCETLTIELEATQWGKQAQKVQLLVDTATLPPKVIAVCGLQNSNASEWNTMLFGSESMAQSLPASKYTIGTAISSTIQLKTLSYLTRSLISEPTADVSFEPMDGGNHAASVAPSITSITFTNEQAVCIPGVGIVPPLTRWTISAKESFAPTLVDDGRDKSIDNAYQRGETQRRQIHPTIKPLATARHLATLLLPPAEYGPRRLFVPFAGVASEMIGAMLAGWEDVQGVELTADHIPVAEARLAYWQARKGALAHPQAAIKVKATTPATDDQLSLFD